MRLIDRNDTSLAIGLVASSLVIFHQPLRVLFDAAHVAEVRYGIDLLPGLTVLVGVFGVHQYRKRLQSRVAESAAATDAARARARSAELERLVAFGRALGNALDPADMEQVFWRHMPAFAGGRELWMLTRRTDSWDSPLRDATAPAHRTVELLESLANAALCAPPGNDGAGGGVLVESDLCLPMIVGDNPVGVVGVRNLPELSVSERDALAAATALLAIAIRNGQLIAQTRESSIRDHLTGCFNRAYAMESLSAELECAKRTRRPLSVLMFDIDEFKAVNDRFGHLTGDAILAAIGSRLATTLRSTDVKCRYGGDEFVLILPDTSLAGAEHVATAVVEALAGLQVPAGGSLISPTVSLGVTSAQEGETDPRAIIASADKALYRAKRAGRNRYVASSLAAAV